MNKLKIKNNKLKLLIVVLVFFLSLFFIKYNDTFGIYRNELNTRVYLTVLDPNSTYEVTFNLNYGQNNTSSIYVEYNQQVGTLPTPTRTDYNFLGWYDGTGDNANRIYSSQIITSPVTFYAHWQKIICKKVTNANNLHTETCASGGGCRVSGINIPLNSQITYGTISSQDSPVAGDAYDCDVNNDGTYNSQTQYGKFTERFYFIREIDNNDDDKAALVYYTSIDNVHGPVDTQHTNKDDIGSDSYQTASGWLPTSSTWTNPDLVDFDSNNGKITRFLNFDDIGAVCGAISGDKSSSYFAECGKWFLFENSRFQSDSLGRSGIWLQQHNNTYYRIHTGTVNVASPNNGASSENMARPVIEIPITALEGYLNAERYTINFNTHGGSPVASIRKYAGETMGTLPESTLEHNDFAGWYTESTYNTLVTSSTLVTGDMTLHAKWTPKQTSTVTLNANGGTINGESTYDLIVDTGSTINVADFPEAVYEGHSLGGWFLDSELTEPFDENVAINQSTLTLYASWIDADCVAKVNGIGYETLADAIDAVPTGTSQKTTVTILKDITLEEAVTIPNNKWVELVGGSYTITAPIANLVTNIGKLDIISGTYISNAANNTASKMIINKGTTATLNISGGNFSNTSTGTIDHLIVENGSSGKVNITGGIFNSYGNSSAINNNGGTMNISGGEIYAHAVTKGQAVYVKGGTVNISGNVYLENVSGTGDSRGAVDNDGGTINITGGTIVSTGYAAVTARNDNGTITIGDKNDGAIYISKPVMRGKTHGLNASNGTVNVYDGLFESLENQTAYTGTIADKPDNIDFTNSTTSVNGVQYYTTYLLAPSITVYFYEETNSTPISVTVDNGMPIGNNLPVVSKQGYYFDGWYIDGNSLYEVTSATEVIGPFNAYAKWVRSVSNATFDNPMNIEINTSDKIEFNESDIESVSYESDAPTIASVDSDGTVHGLAIGTATITMTGSKSEITKTVTVNVTPVMKTVTFIDSKHATITKEVADGSSLGVNMPTDPTDENYAFAGWYIESEMMDLTSETTIYNDITAVAIWKEKINYATLTKNPDPLNLIIGDTGQITLSEKVANDVIEDYSVTSEYPNVASVTKNGNIVTVNALDYGTTTITLNGSISKEEVEILVSVDYLKHTVTFKDGDNPDIEIEVIDGTAIGASNMPADPVKANYLFDGWWAQNGNSSYQVTNETIVDNDIIANSTWTPTIETATIPLTHIVTIGSTNTIPITNIPNGMESYTFSSSNSNIASVDPITGVVTGVALGTTNIKITGTKSGIEKNIEVTVSDITFTVTFMNDNSSVPIDTVSVPAGNSLGENMPANPSETNYIFKGWLISGELTPFTSSTQVNDNMTVIANWRLELDSATIEKNPDPLTFKKGKTGQITLIDSNSSRLVEECTFASSNTNIAEISYSNNVANIFGSDIGEVTVTITGKDSHQPKTVTVTIHNLNNITFDPDNGNTNDITTIQVADGSSIGTNVPTNPTYSGHTFDNWYLYDETNENLTTTRINPNEVITSDRVYKARWAGASDVAAIGINYYPSVALAIEAVEEGTPEEIRILKDIPNITCATGNGVTSNSCSTKGRTTIPANKDITIDGGNFTVECDSSTVSNVFFVKNNGILRIKSGTFLCAKKAGIAVLETEAQGKIYIDGGIIRDTNDRGAIYNLGEVHISGGTISTGPNVKERSVILNTAQSSAKIFMTGGTVIQEATSTTEEKGYGAIKVDSKSSATITGGTVISYSTNSPAIYNKNNLVIGTNDNDDTYDATSPIIQGEQYGIDGTANYSVYDGIIKGKTGPLAVSDDSKINGTEANTVMITDTEDGYYILYYESKYRINFNAVDGSVSPTYLEFNLNTTIDGTNFPTPTKEDYTFGGWYKDSNFETPFTEFTPNAPAAVTYYARWISNSSPTMYRINFNAGDGTVSPNYLEYSINTTIDGTNFPTPTKEGYTFAGWYKDSNFETPFTTFTPDAAAIVTYYAKWTYNSSLTPVVHTITSDAMTTYFANVQSYVNADNAIVANQDAVLSNDNHTTYENNLNSIFSTNSCSACDGDNSCNHPLNGTYCDQPKEYDTGLTDNLLVYSYDNGVKGSTPLTYVTSTNGKIYNMIPGKTYYWESSTDNTKYGVVTATGSRRTLKTAVRNIRDLGGLSVSYTDLDTGNTVTGTIDYGRLYRGAEIKTAQGVNDLEKLGITREVDVRENNDGTQTYKMDYYDTGTKTSWDDIKIINYHINPIATAYLPTEADSTDKCASNHSDNYDNLKLALRKVMEMVVNNHDSIFFHCTIGTDRTGTLAYFLEGLLGVSEEDRLRDYELTYFYGLTNRTRFHDTLNSKIVPRFYSMYKSYPTNADIYAYYKYREYTPKTGEMTDDELLTAFRRELIH